MRLFLAIVLFSAAFSAAAEKVLPFTLEPVHPRKIGVGKKTLLTLKPGNFEIVVLLKFPRRQSLPLRKWQRP